MNTHSTQISNVLIIGSGGAGLRAAIEAKQQGMDVVVLGKVRDKEQMFTLSLLLEGLMQLLEMLIPMIHGSNILLILISKVMDYPNQK